jgi:hypothetical protein
MRQVRLFAVVLFLLLILFLSGSAFADSIVTMTFIGPGGNNSGGVYTYPYTFSINGGAPVSLLCDAFNFHVTPGETWSATVTGLLDGQGLFGNQPLNYAAAGLIFQGIMAGTIDVNAGNWAIWGLFAPNAQSNPYYVSSGAGDLALQFLALAANAPASAFQGIVLYTPIPGSQSWLAGGTPQEYIGFIQVPEPGELSLLLTTVLFGLATFVFRNKLGLAPVRNNR